MKVCCVRVGTELLIGKKQDSITNKLAKQLLSVGAVLSSYITVPNNADEIFNALKLSRSCDIVLVVGENTATKNQVVKEAVARYFNLSLVLNSDAKENVINYYNNKNLSLPSGAEQEFYLPQNAIVFGDGLTELQSFMVGLDNNKTLFYLPDNDYAIKHFFENYIKLELQNLAPIKLETETIKLFGISEKEIYNLLSDLVRNIYKILFITFPNGLDTTLLIRYSANLETDIVNSFIQKVYEKLNKYIYSTDEDTLPEHLVDLLSVSNKTVSVVETVSAGKITNMILEQENEVTEQNSNSKSNYLNSSVILPSPQDGIAVLKINESIVNTYGPLSVEAAYEMAATMLEQSGSDYVLCTLAEQIVESSVAQASVFIAVGDQDGIHVYKNNFTGTKQQLIKSISQTGLFYLIKNIKQKGLLFSEIIV